MGDRVVEGTATLAAEEAPLGLTGEVTTAEEEEAEETASGATEEEEEEPAGAELAPEGLTVVTTGLMVEEVTVERAGQLVTVAAHEVMAVGGVVSEGGVDGPGVLAEGVVDTAWECLQSGGSGTLEQLDGDGTGVGRGVVPGDGVGRTGGNDLVLGGGQDSIEPSGLSQDGRDPGEEGSGRHNDTHFESWLVFVVVY
ncbi:hypothetical protein VP1G_11087 [Cytospora mali]|uniref:Uncharacterized protein n=1 Tax=Cytospora mali TaxID=578113 RepID=A0A194V681_CYTMA|nr:hypothetical protein VP1G_11087 [Valsa mali var. pyri (nom. inval.)]